MRGKSIIFLFVTVLFLLTQSKPIFAQAKSISIEAKGRLLIDVLNELTDKYKYRFAYDHDQLANIKITIKASNYTIDKLLKEIGDDYGFNFKLIGGTYALVKTEKIKKSEPTKNQTTINDQKPVAKKESTRQIWVNISGTVSDRQSGIRLKFCNLVFNGNSGGTTNELGYFSVRIKSGEKLTLKITQLGYKTLNQIISVRENLNLDIKLTPVSFFTDELNTDPDQKILLDFSDENQYIAFNPDIAGYLPGTETNDLVNVIEMMPGIQFHKNNKSGFSIRGSNPSHSPVYIDEIPVFANSHLWNNFSMLNSKFIDQTFISRGGYGASYGNRSSGVIEMTGKNGAGDVLVAEFETNLLHVNTYVGIPVNNKLSIALSFRQSFGAFTPAHYINSLASRNIYAETLSGVEWEGSVLQPSINYRDLNAKISFRPDRKQELIFSYLYSYNKDNRNSIFSENVNFFRNKADVSHANGASLQWLIQSNRYWSNSFIASFGTGKAVLLTNISKQSEIDTSRVQSDNYHDFTRLNETNLTWKSEIKRFNGSHQFGSGFTQYGLNYKFDHNVKEYNGIEKEYSDSIRNHNSIYLWNAYYQGTLRLHDVLKVYGGVRTLYDFSNTKFYVLPHAGLELEPTSNLKFYYSFGLYAQHFYKTSRIDMDRNSIPIWYLPKNSGQVIRSQHNIIGLKYNKKGLEINIEGYIKKNRGVTTPLAFKIDALDWKPLTYTNIWGSQLNHGIDIYAHYRIGAFHHIFSYSLNESREKIDGINGYKYFPTINDRMHQLKLTELITYKNWIASVSWQIATGAAYLNTFSTRTNFVFDRTNNFSQVDLALTKQFQWHEYTFEAGMTILNFFNKRNELTNEYFKFEIDQRYLSIQSTITAPAYTPMVFLKIRYD